MALTEKEKEMVAIGASIGGNCIPCLKWHYKKCVELGFSNQELGEAFAIAKMVKEVPNGKIYETADKLAGVEPADDCSTKGCCEEA